MGSLTAVALIGLVITLVFAGQVVDPDAVQLARERTDQTSRAGSIDAFRAGMLLAAGLAIAARSWRPSGSREPRPAARGQAVNEPAAAPAES